MLSRNLFTIGAGLCHTKDVRDFFVDCVEKVGLYDTFTRLASLFVRLTCQIKHFYSTSTSCNISF